MAKLTSEDDSGGLPVEAVFRSDFPDLNLLDPSWEKLTPEQRIGLALRAEAAASLTDKAIANSEGASFEYARSEWLWQIRLGFIGAYEGTGSRSVLCADSAVERRHAARSLDVGCTVTAIELGSPEEIGRKAAERAFAPSRRAENSDLPGAQ